MKNNDELLHYGVLGMKWGRRKSTKSSGGILSRFRRKKRIQNQKQNTEQQKEPEKGVNERLREQQFINEYKNRDKMSTRQIQARTNRLNAEMAFERAVTQKARDRQAAAQRAAEAEAMVKAQKKAKNMKRLKVALTVVGELGLDKLTPTVSPKDYGFENEEAIKNAGSDLYNKYKTAKKGSDEMRNILKSATAVTKAVAKAMDDKPDPKQYIEQSGVKMEDKNTLLHSIYDSEDQDILLHGTKWSEEAKERVRQARRAGRPVRDMFANFYKSSKRTVNSGARKLAGNTIYRKKLGKIRKQTNAVNKFRNTHISKVRSEEGRAFGNGVARAELKRLNKQRKRYTNATTGQIAKDFAKEGAKQSSKLIKKGQKTLKRGMKDLGKGSEKLANKGLKLYDELTTSKKEKALDKSARIKANKARKKAKKKANSIIGKVTGKNAKIEGQKAYNKAYDKEMKKDKTPTVDSLVKSAKKSLRKKANKGISKLEKTINKGLRKADDLIETESESRLRKKAKRVGSKAARKEKSSREVFGGKLRNPFGDQKANRMNAGANMQYAESKIRETLGDKKGAKKALNKAKSLAKGADKRDKNAIAKARKNAEKKYTDKIYDKQIKLGRFGSKKKKRK